MNYDIIAAGDSYNDTAMLQEASNGILFRPPQNVIEEFPHQEGWDETILTAVRTSGTAVVYTGLTLVLAMIPWYFFTDLKFQAQMGFFLSMLLLINVVLALTLHPFLIHSIKPRFISRSQKSAR